MCSAPPLSPYLLLPTSSDSCPHTVTVAIQTSTPSSSCAHSKSPSVFLSLTITHCLTVLLAPSHHVSRPPSHCLARSLSSALSCHLPRHLAHSHAVSLVRRLTISPAISPSRYLICCLTISPAVSCHLPHHLAHSHTVSL